MSRLRDYIRLHMDYYLDDVLLAAADECPAALHLWPVLIGTAKRASHYEDNPEGVIRTTVSKLARDAYVPVDQVRAALDALAEGELLVLSVEGQNRLRITLSKFQKWQNARGGVADRQDTKRANASRENMPIRHNIVTASSHTRHVEREGEREKRKSPNGDSSSSGKPNPDNRQKSNEPVGRNPNIEAREVFDHWRVTMRKRSNSVFSTDRKSKVVARLREGYTVSQLKEAVTGYSMSAFHMGDNPDGKLWNDLELICRSGSKVEKGMELAVGGANHAASNRAPAAEMSKAEVHRAWLMREVGDVVEVDRLMREWEQQQGVAS